jgi:hypothetical protein
LSSHCAILLFYNIILLHVPIISVTLSTTQSLIDYYTETATSTYRVYYYSRYCAILKGNCYNYLDGWYESAAYAITYRTRYSLTWSTINTKKYSTTISYIYTFSSYTLTTSYSITYTNSQIISTKNTVTNIIAFTYYTSNLEYSTITRILAPSPSYLPKQKCTCIIQLCNKINLILILINIYV